MLDRLDLSRRGWGRVILGTIAGTLACVAIALYVDSFNFLNLDTPGRNRAILINVLLRTFRQNSSGSYLQVVRIRRQGLASLQTQMHI